MSNQITAVEALSAMSIQMVQHPDCDAEACAEVLGRTVASLDVPLSETMAEISEVVIAHFVEIGAIKLQDVPEGLDLIRQMREA